MPSMPSPSHVCPICNGTDTTAFLDRPGVPVHQNLVLPHQDAAAAVGRGDLRMRVCEACGFVFNAAFDPSLLAYGRDYDNTQSCSPSFDRYLDGLIQALVADGGLDNATVVEVGCGKGHFLRKLVSQSEAAIRGVGFDPSYAGPDSDLDGRLRFERRFYDQECAALHADVVICRHVIEHVSQPMDLLAAVRAALADASNARVYFETPCVDWILENRVLWDFFYEHCSLFTERSLRHAFELSDFTVDRVDHVFGGQYLWIAARPRDPLSPLPPPPLAGATPAIARTYGAAEQAMRRTWHRRIEDLRQRGKVALWGAGAKGATFATLVDADRTLIDCVVDLNPAKQGGHLPGSAHPVVAPADLPARGVRSAVLMNPNYRDENRRLLAEAGISVTLVDWSE